MWESQILAGRAAQCRKEADMATLASVRERRLRAETAWIAMSARSHRIEAARDERMPPESD